MSSRTGFTRVGHAHQGSLGEGYVEQSRGRSKRQPDSDLRQKQEGRHRPELIKRKDKGEQTAESFSELAEIEGDRGEQVEAQRNPTAPVTSTALTMAIAPQTGRKSPATRSTSCR
jgi:hypothetical protein